MIIPIVVITSLAIMLAGVAIAVHLDAEWFFGLTLIVVFGVMFGALHLNTNACVIEEVERVEIYAGYNDMELEGQFFILGGRIGEKDVVYYWVNDNGVKSKHSQPMSASVFIEDGGEYLLLKSRTCNENVQWLYICRGLYQVEFHVPENSINQMYQYQ